jgi:hypothetical protein
MFTFLFVIFPSLKSELSLEITRLKAAKGSQQKRKKDLQKKHMKKNPA